MLILRVGGPVISARRSSRPGAGGATSQSPDADLGRAGEEVDRFPGGDALAALAAGGQQLGPPARMCAVELGDEGQRLRRQDLLETGMQRTLDPWALRWSEHDVPSRGDLYGRAVVGVIGWRENV